MVDSVNFEVPTWSQIYELLLLQAQKIRGAYEPDVVVGVSRGGLVPARVLVDLLGSPELATVQVELYLDVALTLPRPKLKQPLTMAVKGKKVLVVDDIADSGRTLEVAAIHMQAMGALETKTATLYFKPQSSVKPDFYEKETVNWVVFPWDVRETLQKILRHRGGKRLVNAELGRLVKAGLPKKLADRLVEDIK